MQRHFPFEISRETLHRWFDTTGVRFFSTYGDRWVSATARERRLNLPPADVESVATSVATELGLGDHAGLLAYKFRDFIGSGDPEDNEMLWHFGRSMFAARLMAADLAADPVSARELSGAKLLLDTNVLLAIALETPEQADALSGLARAFATLGITLGYLRETQDEYERRVTSWGVETSRQLDRYGISVLREAVDDHLQAAIRRVCVHDEDFEVYYKELRQLPTSLHGIKIEAWGDELTAHAADNGVNDSDLVEQILKVWAENRMRPKRESAARHDAALTAVVRALRGAGQPCLVLSTDRTMQRLAAQWSAGVDTPLWITLDTLLQVLAVEEEGSGMDATVFAPLLSRLVAYDVQASRYAYTLEDIQTLSEILEGAESLPESDVKSMLRRIHSQRLAGATRDDEELALNLRRMYQRVRSRLGSDLKESQANEAAALRRADDLETENRRLAQVAREAQLQKLANEYTSELQREARDEFRRATVSWVAYSGIAVTAAVVLLDIALPGAGLDAVVDVTMGVLGTTFTLVGRLWTTIVPRYRDRMSQAAELARKRAEKELQAARLQQRF